MLSWDSREFPTFDDPRSKLEVVASFIVTDINGVTKIPYVNDVCIGPPTNKVYFTSSTEIRPDIIIGTHHPDTTCSASADVIRGIPTGQFVGINDSATDQVRVLARGLHFSNDISVHRDEDYLVIAETFGPRIWKYYFERRRTSRRK